MSDNVFSTERHIDNPSEYLESLVHRAIQCDVITGEDGGFVEVMASRGKMVRKDIPAAFEAYSLLSHQMLSSPILCRELDHLAPAVSVSKALYLDVNAHRVLLLMPVPAGMLSVVCLWLTEHLHSAQVKAMPGTLALPFAIETFDGTEFLVPEWCAAFFVNDDPQHCVPLLTMQSALEHPEIGQEWTRIALHRLRVFGIPTETAMEALERASKRESGS